MACHFVHARRFSVYCSLPRCFDTALHLWSNNPVLDAQPRESLGVPEEQWGMREVCEGLMTVPFTFPLLLFGDMPNPPLYFPQSTMSLSCPFSHSMPCTTWLLKIFFTYKQQAQPFQPLLPAGDGIDTAGDGIGAGWSGKTSVLVLI